MSTAESAATGEVARDSADPPARGVRVDVPQTENEQRRDGELPVGTRVRLLQSFGWHNAGIEGVVVAAESNRWLNGFDVPVQWDRDAGIGPACHYWREIEAIPPAAALSAPSVQTGEQP